MFSISDILSMGKDSYGQEATEAWEREISKGGSPKLKFPVQATSENLEPVDFNFSEPTVVDPVGKKEQKGGNSAKEVDLTRNSKRKKSKPKLF